MLKLKFSVVRLIPLVAIFLLLSPARPVAQSSPTQKTISAHRAADFIHAVIETDRTIYSQYIVERLGETVSLKASENWEKANALPLPAQFLLMSSKIVNAKSLGIQYRLISLWPINKKNASKTREEKEGLKKVSLNPGKPYVWTAGKDGQVIFNAVYPDLAVTKSCVHCHNNHPKSPKRDFKRNDVMGGIHISFPISRMGKTSSKKKIIHSSGSGGRLRACDFGSGSNRLR